MKNIHIIAFVFLMTFVSCNYSTDKKLNRASTGSTISEATPPIDSVEVFLSLFKDTTFTKLHLYSPSETVDGKRFAGKVIDKSLRKYLITDKLIRANIDTESDLFACYKFKLSDSQTVLIIRRQSQYTESAIDMCLWLNKYQYIDKEIELADAFGDGQWYFQKDAWFVDLNNDGKFDIVTRRIDTWEDDVDARVGVLHATDSVTIRLAKDDGFGKSKMAIDTSLFKMFNMKE